MSKPTKTNPANRLAPKRVITKVSATPLKPTLKSIDNAKTSTKVTSTVLLKKSESPKFDKKQLDTKTAQPKTDIKTKLLAQKVLAPKAPLQLKSQSTLTKKPKPPQPLRAKPIVGLQNKISKIQEPLNKLNVMNTVHNVTVTSPPSKRKEIINNAVRDRTRTRTLDPEEVVVLKDSLERQPRSSESFVVLKSDIKAAVIKIEKNNENISPSSDTAQESIGETSGQQKASISYELNFGKSSDTLVPSTAKEVRQTESNISGKSETTSEDYEDDFESYESDFETGTSSSVEISNSKKSSDSEIKTSEKCTSTESDATSNDAESDEETQLPVTVIHKELFDDRKLDSGNFDMNSRKEKIVQLSQMVDSSLDTTTSEHLDSGISYAGSLSSRPSSSTIYVTAGCFNPSKIARRGMELMNKIELDEVTFTLFELKPVSYEYYMKIYGNMNSEQVGTQTNENRLAADTQTDDIQTRSMWTQHPPQYDLKFLNENRFVHSKNFCGELENVVDIRLENFDDPIEESLAKLNLFSKLSKKERDMRPKMVDVEKMNDFLKRASSMVASALVKSKRNPKNKSSELMTLKTGELNATTVIKVFGNPKLNLVLTIHENLDECPNEFLNLIVVWDINQPNSWIKILSAWSAVSWAEICTEMRDVVVSGLSDGSIALWDLRESYSLSTKTDSGLVTFAPTQSTTPTVISTKNTEAKDLGAVVCIRFFRPNSKFRSTQNSSIQMVSLNDSGIITIWTLLEQSKPNSANVQMMDVDDSKIEYISPYARVRLVQSEICDLRAHLELKEIRNHSKFDKTRSYFENDLFTDSALKELQESQMDLKSGIEGIRFTALDAGCDRAFVATNRNFIISCSKLLKPELFRKILADESKFLFPTSLKLVENEDFLIVGLSNGSVIVLNCNPQKPILDNKFSTTNIASRSYYRPRTGSDRAVPTALDGKSCTIQNIIRNERLADEYRQQLSDNTEYDDLSQSNNRYDSNAVTIFDQQILLSGLVLRKDLVQCLEISYDGTKLFALMDHSLRIFDFVTNTEISSEAFDGVRGICLVKRKSNQQLISILTNENNVHIKSVK